MEMDAKKLLNKVLSLRARIKHEIEETDQRLTDLTEEHTCLTAITHYLNYASENQEGNET